ncbi:hypothetical protein JTB14_020911 [Gonioctena quinquepunctata]|nr:hypothetical protein JTB14_020911 [Gonioctena quinquepunctata]
MPLISSIEAVPRTITIIHSSPFIGIVKTLLIVPIVRRFTLPTTLSWTPSPKARRLAVLAGQKAAIARTFAHAIFHLQRDSASGKSAGAVSLSTTTGSHGAHLSECVSARLCTSCSSCLPSTFCFFSPHSRLPGGEYNLFPASAMCRMPLERYLRMCWIFRNFPE